MIEKIDERQKKERKKEKIDRSVGKDVKKKEPVHSVYTVHSNIIESIHYGKQ
jgi:hypothetical protein